MENVKYFTAYDSEKNIAKEIFDDSSKKISDLKEKEKGEIDLKKKEFSSAKKSDNTAIKSIEKKKDANILKVDEELYQGTNTLESKFQAIKSELEESIKQASVKCVEEIETINFNKTNINSNAENSKIAIQKKYDDITLNRDKAFNDLDAKNGESLSQAKENYQNKENTTMSDINNRINNYFNAIKELEDEAKAKIEEKKETTKKLNTILEEERKAKEIGYNTGVKDNQALLNKDANKQEISSINKTIASLNKNYYLEVKRIEGEKVNNTKVCQAFEKEISDELNLNLEAKRKEIIATVTTLQSEIDVAKLELDIFINNAKGEYNKEKANLSFLQLQEKKANEVECLTSNNKKEVELNVESKNIEICKKNEETTINKYKIDIEFETDNDNVLKYLLTNTSNEKKESLNYEANKEIAKINAKIDNDGYLLDKELRIIFLNAQKEVLSLKQAVYQVNNEMIYKTNAIVIDYKLERIAKQIKPFIDQIKLKQKAFDKEYNDLIAAQNKEYDDTMKMLDEVNSGKIDYLESSKQMIAETDDDIKQKYDELIKNERERYENTVKELTSMNDVIVKAYNNKMADDLQKANEEIERLNSLNEYINEVAIKVSNMSKSNLDKATDSNADFNGSFDEYYANMIKQNEDNYNDLVNKRNAALNDLLAKLDQEFQAYCQNSANERKDKENALEKFRQECSDKKLKLDGENKAFQEKANKEKDVFEKDRNKEISDLKAKNDLEIANALKAMNSSNLLAEKNLRKVITGLNKNINKTKAKVPSYIKFNYKNANVVKNKKWWIKQNNE